MQLLSAPKAEYLLEAPIEVLHAESQTWLKELDFWADEMAFFNKLLHHNKLSGSFPSERVAEIDKELVTLNAEMLDKVRPHVGIHERLLVSSIKNKSMTDEQVYRETHIRLLSDMVSFATKLRKFKQRLFSVIER